MDFNFMIRFVTHPVERRYYDGRHGGGGKDAMALHMVAEWRNHGEV